MILLTILFILCIVFITLRWFSRSGNDKRFWPEYIDLSESSSPPSSCSKDSDCSSRNQKCFESKCYETLSPQQKCDPKTGMWEKTAAGDKLKCVCLHPHLVTQKIAGGFSCDVHINCSGPYGKVSNSNPFQCDCQKNFRMDPSSGQCVRKTESDRDAETHCPSGYFLSTSPEAKDVFHPDYLAQFSRAARCLKEPCTFNVLNHNSPLYYGTPEFAVRNSKKICYCSCDPRFGHFGVRLKNVGHYLVGDEDNDPYRYNACASIYKEEPERPKLYNFDIYCYFYVKDKSKPISFLVFHSLPNDDLVDFFKGKSSIVIIDDKDSFPYTIDQYILQNIKPIYYRRRFCFEPSRGWHRLKCMKNVHMLQMDIKNCSDTPEKKYEEKHEAFINNVLQYNFVCRLPNYTGDEENPVVVNPYVVDYPDISEFSHGYHIKIAKESGKIDDWFVKLAFTPYYNHLDLDLDASLNLVGKKWKHPKKPPLYYIPGVRP